MANKKHASFALAGLAALGLSACGGGEVKYCDSSLLEVLDEGFVNGSGETADNFWECGLSPPMDLHRKPPAGRGKTLMAPRKTATFAAAGLAALGLSACGSDKAVIDICPFLTEADLGDFIVENLDSEGLTTDSYLACEVTSPDDFLGEGTIILADDQQVYAIFEVTSGEGGEEGFLGEWSLDPENCSLEITVLEDSEGASFDNLSIDLTDAVIEGDGLDLTASFAFTGDIDIWSEPFDAIEVDCEMMPSVE